VLSCDPRTGQGQEAPTRDIMNSALGVNLFISWKRSIITITITRVCLLPTPSMRTGQVRQQHSQTGRKRGYRGTGSRIDMVAAEEPTPQSRVNIRRKQTDKVMRNCREEMYCCVSSRQPAAHKVPPRFGVISRKERQRLMADPADALRRALAMQRRARGTYRVTACGDACRCDARGRGCSALL